MYELNKIQNYLLHKRGFLREFSVELYKVFFQFEKSVLVETTSLWILYVTREMVQNIYNQVSSSCTYFRISSFMWDRCFLVNFAVVDN